jgi:EAL domain-containing protein (putative c-di-GMP-specific phosphodiesterase class I)
MLDSLKALGVGVALDDFGTGYSSLSLLQHMPVDSLKIDRSFVDRLGAAGEEGALVRAILGLGRALGLEVVAEGIETEPQASALRRLGCRLGQGFHFARPLEAAQVEALAAAAPSADAA